ncbi:MAG: AMP-binding protein [Armatimonadetes bacterium]|nr:AMP-binding protein [Armatimonadota bacterium]
MSTTGHIDTFAHDNLPPLSQWPDIINLEALGYPERLNCAEELLDKAVGEGFGDKIAIYAPSGHWTYADLLESANRIAHVLQEDLHFVSGERVLLHSPNNPMMAACWFAILKAGGIVVATMPLLRDQEIAKVVDKARVRIALCDHRVSEEVLKAKGHSLVLKDVVCFGDGELEGMMKGKPTTFANVNTAADDVSLIAFTSGTTGVPKGTMHFHRDVLAICDLFPKHVVKPTEDDIFIGSPPLAFTFGLGGLLLFPMRVRASTVLLEKAPPADLAKFAEAYGATVMFTAPTGYRFMLDNLGSYNLSKLRKCVSAGETLPKATSDAWFEKTGVRIIDGIGSTEILHVFISASGDDIRPGSTGKTVPGYEAKIIDEEGKDLPAGSVGRLAVRGPTGCRYLADERQLEYVQNGWNITGDAYLMDADGYFWFQARTDDMILSGGYNIAGPEVEAALLLHPAVKECAVVACPDEMRGNIVKAYVVLREGELTACPETIHALQDFVKEQIAPYKYPRAIEFLPALPRTESGKVQRFKLREPALQQVTP